MAADPAVQFTHSVSGSREFERQHGHTEGFVLVLRVDAAQVHDFGKGHRHLAAEPVHDVVHQIRAESVMAGFNRRVGRKNAFLASRVAGVLKVLARCHFFPHQLQGEEGGVALVHVKNRSRGGFPA